jgi:glycosyltransferase involved in cell wall biosynthesis
VLIREIKDAIKSHGIELVYTLTAEISLAYVANFLFRKVCVLHTVHDAINHDVKYKNVFERLKDNILVRIPNKEIIRKAQNLVTNSKPQLEYLQNIFPQKKVFYVPFPTLVNEEIKGGTKTVKELESVNDYILFFGSVNLYKGVHLLYNLYINNKHKFGGRKLVIAGAGNDYFGDIQDNDVIRINRYIDDSEVRYLFIASFISLDSSINLFPNSIGNSSSVHFLALNGYDLPIIIFGTLSLTSLLNSFFIISPKSRL